MDEFYLRNAKIMSALSTPMRLQILDISNTQIQEYVQQTRGVEKDKANAILASMRSGKGIALIGAFCPLLWMSILMGQSWGAILFNFCHDEAMMETADSVRQYGVLVPAIARPDPEGGYELVAGHRRHRASELAEKETMPVIVRDLDDDAATIIMVDSNLQRESLLPSERAFAYKMKLEAVKHQGARTDLTSAQVGPKLTAAEKIAENSPDSKSQIKRYIRLTELIPELLDMVDEWVGRECCQCTDAGTGLPTAKTVTFRKTSRPSLGKSTIKYASQKDIKKAVSGLRRVYAAITLDEAKK